MKILQLNLENITSLAGQHSIDFEQEPLNNAGLIAITGMTGSGKSSLLDAMCLALFNEVPRLRGANGALEDVTGDSIQINSPSNLLRRGTAFGFAEVIFLAQDNKRYSAKWSIKRARDKATGKLQAVQRELRCLEDNQILATKATDVSQHIDHLLGLDFKQFTKTVLLAQSEVTAFIKANDNERAALLEYLTDSDIYSKIGTLAFEKNKQAATQVANIERKIGEQQPLSHEDRHTLQQQIEQSKTQLIQHEQRAKKTEQQLQWYEQLDALQHNIQQAQQQEVLAQQQWTSFAPQQQLLQQLEQFEPIRAQFEQLIQVTQQHAEKQKQQQQKQHAFDALQQQYTQIEQQLKHCEQRLIAQQEKQQQHIPAVQQALKTELSLQQIQQHVKELLNKQNLNTSHLQTEQQALQKLQQQQTQLLNSKQQHEQQQLESKVLALFDQDQRASHQFAHLAQQRIELIASDAHIFNSSINEQKQQLQQQHTKLQIFIDQYQSTTELEQQKQQKEGQLRRLEKFLATCDTIANQLNHWQNIEQDQHNSQLQLTTLEQQLAEQLNKRDAAQHAINTAKIQADTTEHIWQQQQLLTQHSVEELRAQLQPNQACMVCGSTEHPFATHEQLAAVLNQSVQQHYLQAKQHLEHCQQQWQQEDKQYAALLQQHQHLQQQQEKLAQQRQQLLQDLEQTSPNFYQQIQHQLHPVDAQRVLNDKKQEFTQQSQTLEQQIKQLTQQLNDWHTLQQQQLAQQQKLDKRLHLEALEQDYIQPLPPELQQQWRHDCKLTAATIQQQLKQRQTAKQALEQIQQQQLTLDKQLHEQHVKLNQLQDESAQLQQSLQQQQTQQAGGSQTLAQLFNTFKLPTDIQTSQQWQQWLNDELTQCQQQLEHARQQQRQQQQEQVTLQADIQALSNQLLELNQRIQQHQHAISDWHHQYPELDEPTIQRLQQLTHVDKSGLQNQQRQLETALQKAQTALNLLLSQQSEHRNTQPELERESLHAQHLHIQQQLQQTKDELQQLSVTLQLDDHIQQQAQRYLQELEKAKAEHHRWDKIASLIGSADGSKFKRIAQQYHLQMLVTLANQHLVQLTPRYEIRHVENSLNLSIVDHFMNDEIRAVATLSGGESFLISLALALGIASMASGHTRLESLFIDEGFGTLDQSSLQMVMDALDRLQSQGRTVIVISHISEMHERIPVQIKVVQQGAGASKIEVVG